MELDIAQSDVHSSRRAGEAYRHVAQLSLGVSNGALAIKKAVSQASATSRPVRASDVDCRRLVELLTAARDRSGYLSGRGSSSLDAVPGVATLVERLSQPFPEVGEQEIRTLDTVCAALDEEASNLYRHLGGR